MIKLDEKDAQKAGDLSRLKRETICRLWEEGRITKNEQYILSYLPPIGRNGDVYRVNVYRK